MASRKPEYLTRNFRLLSELSAHFNVSLEEQERAKSFIQIIKRRFQHQPHIYMEFSRIMRYVTAKRLHFDHTIAKLEDTPDALMPLSAIHPLIQGHNDLVRSFNCFLPHGLRVTIDDEDDHGERIGDDEEKEDKGIEGFELLQEAINFVNKIKVRDMKVYESFLHVMAANSKDKAMETVDNIVLCEKIAAVFADHEDLLKEFIMFIPESEVSSLALANTDGVPRKAKEGRKKRKLDVGSSKKWDKPIHELDLSRCERCTPSYRLLPRDYPRPSITGRTEIASQVLNDDWVMVPPKTVANRSRKRSDKLKRFEESMNENEGERYELDMFIAWLQSATEYAEGLMNKLKKEDTMGRKEDEDQRLVMGRIHLLRCIGRIYGNRSDQVTDSFHQNPLRSLPCILRGLKDKHEELKHSKELDSKRQRWIQCSDEPSLT